MLTVYSRSVFQSFSGSTSLQDEFVQLVCYQRLWLFLKWAILCLFLIYFWSFETNNTILQQINVKNVRPVSGSGICAHDLLIMHLLL